MVYYTATSWLHVKFGKSYNGDYWQLKQILKSVMMHNSNKYASTAENIKILKETWKLGASFREDWIQRWHLKYLPQLEIELHVNWITFRLRNAFLLFVSENLSVEPWNTISLIQSDQAGIHIHQSQRISLSKIAWSECGSFPP